MSATVTKLSKAEMAALVKKAEAAAAEAFAGAAPTAMVVGSPKNLMGSLTGGDDGGLDESQPIYVVNEGVCGFAWVNIKPANSRFANYLRAKGKGSTDSYYGGLTVWGEKMGIPRSQSYERKMAAATAYAAVLSEAGITCYATGRLD